MSRFYVVTQSLLIAGFAAAVFLAPPALDVPDGLRASGLVLCVAGLGIVFSALWAMGRVMQVSPQPKADGHLVTRGVYGWLRHPMYTGMTLIVVGLALRAPSLPVGIVGGALIALLLAKARYEERLLALRYADYPAYRSKTWGVIPLIRG